MILVLWERIFKNKMNKNSVIVLRVTSEMKTKLMELAAASGKKLSDYLRGIFQECIDKNLHV